MLPPPYTVHDTPCPDLTGLVQTTGCRVMSSGRFAVVHEGILNGQSVAIKLLRYHSQSREADVVKRFHREIRFWYTLRHPNIVPFLGITTDFSEHGLVHAVYPWYTHGNVVDYLKTRQNANRLSIITHVASGLEYVHGESIVHADLKGSNILIDDNHVARIADFGLARILNKSSFITPAAASTMRSHVTTEIFADVALRHKNENGCDRFDDAEDSADPSTTAGWRWKAVELMTAPSAKHAIALVTQKADIWSFAMTVCEIFSGEVPFQHIKSDPAVILFVAKHGGRPLHGHYPGISADVWNVLERCWDADPSRRPAASELCRFYASMAPPLAHL